jgi:hypothetical protein
MFPYEKGDRVVAMVNDVMVKGRVASVAPNFGRVGVTFAKGMPPMLFNAPQVFPLYRYVDGGKGVVLLAAAAGK